MNAGLSKALGQACVVISVVAMGAGVCGMVLSSLGLASASKEDIAAGSAGFVAGAILIGAGLISLAIQSAKPRDVRDENARNE